MWRIWDDSRDYVHFIMLNPSTADAEKNDPTVERCQRFALRWGFGGLHVGNLFAFRSTLPENLKTHPDPVGPGNNRTLLYRARRAARVVCAWGNHGKHLDRAETVRALLRKHGIPLHVLRITRQGEPGHPLYLPKHSSIYPWEN
ncbi:MAG: hypothetical protein COV67_09900 [Nitrospinae bacterium CG11_big_fil_rev_8_21_14_0_20_56_8]|nr:MAG: hypothetical protein COV67_09900 [Nitrospinae bacterium CG11_big_fil_rev_8_21_14_0_20_56_8]